MKNNSNYKIVVLFASILLILVMSSCETLNQVKPWERGDLSGNLMKPDLNPTEKFDRNHIYFSKEASLGGLSAGGGGCGCN